MDIEKACNTAEELAKEYNAEGTTPFPFDKILEKEPALRIIYTEQLPQNLSGVIIYEKDPKTFLIAINQTKPKTRQYFTIAHELGHYYLHQDYLKQEGIIVDDGDLGVNPSLYRSDEYNPSELEKEANNFAASLIMPSRFVVEAWSALKDIEECARIFGVSVSAMSIRLERLNLVH